MSLGVLSRTAGAFWLSAQKLFKQNEKIYFWTFTFNNVPMDDKSAMEDWNLLHKRLRSIFSFRIGGGDRICTLEGLRVAELHRHHGLHFHCLVNERIPLERVKRLCRGNGLPYGERRYLDFGRMSVDACNEDTVDYLCKYLTSTYRKTYQIYGGRRWGTMGGFKHVGVRDVVYDTPWHRSRDWLFRDQKTSYSTCMMIGHYTALWGSPCDWPAEYRGLVWRQRNAQRCEWMRHRELSPWERFRKSILTNREWDGLRDMYERTKDREPDPF